MFTSEEQRVLEHHIMRMRADFFDRTGKFPTRLFLDRTTYLRAIMTPDYSRELNASKTLLGLELYQCSRIFGEKPVLEVLE